MNLNATQRFRMGAPSVSGMALAVVFLVGIGVPGGGQARPAATPPGQTTAPTQQGLPPIMIAAAHYSLSNNEIPPTFALSLARAPRQIDAEINADQEVASLQWIGGHRGICITTSGVVDPKSKVGKATAAPKQGICLYDGQTGLFSALQPPLAALRQDGVRFWKL